MGVIFLDGFDNYTFLPLKWSECTTHNCASIVPNAGRDDVTQALQFTETYSESDQVLGHVFDYSLDEVIIGFALKKVSSDNMGYLELSFNDGETKQSYLRFYDNTVYYNNGDETNKQGMLGALILGDWNYFEAHIKFDLVSGTVTLRNNGNTFLHITDTNTIAGTNNYIDRIRLSVHPTIVSTDPYYFIDDLYVSTVSGTVNNGFLGNCKVKTLYPTNSGTLTEFNKSDLASSMQDYQIVTGPHIKDTTTYSIHAYEYNSVDDGYANTYNGDTTIHNDLPTLDMYVAEDSYKQLMWLRFSNVVIPNNAKIITAHVKLNIEANNYWAYITQKAAIEADVNAKPIISREDFNSRTSFDYIQFYNSTGINIVEFKDSIQLLVDSLMWDGFNGGTVQILQRDVHNPGWPDHNHTAFRYTSFDAASDPYALNSPKLYVEYQLPGNDSGKYIYSDMDKITDTYRFDSLSSSTKIHAVSQSNITKMALNRANPNTPNLGGVILNGADKYVVRGGKLNDLQYRESAAIWQQNPVTSSGWLSTDLNGFEFGITTISG